MRNHEVLRSLPSAAATSSRQGLAFFLAGSPGAAAALPGAGAGGGVCASATPPAHIKTEKPRTRERMADVLESLRGAEKFAWVRNGPIEFFGWAHLAGLRSRYL